MMRIGYRVLRVFCLSLTLLWAALVWPLPSSSIARADGDDARRHVTIPFTSLPGHGHIVVRIRFNDALTGNFLLDTGSFASLMDETFAKKLGLKMVRTYRRAPVAASALQIYDMTIDHMLVGDMSLRDVHMLVVPHHEMPKGGSESVCAQEEAKDRRLHPERYENGVAPLDRRLDGILGMDYLREFALFIDFEHEQITGWAYGNVQRDDLTAYGMENATVVPLASDGQHLNAYFVNVGFETPAGRVIEKEEVDTGSETTMMTPHHADKIKVAVLGNYFAQTLYGCLPFSAGTVDNVDVDGIGVGGAHVSFTRKAPEGFPLLLGYDVFSRCRVLFDFPANKMYLAPIPSIEKESQPKAQYSDTLPYTPGPNGEVFLTFQFDGGKTGTFALDTGTAMTVISPDLASSLHLSLTPLPVDNGNAEVSPGHPAMTSKLPVMRFGGMGVSGFDCMVGSSPILVAGHRVDGILGNDFFSAFLPFIDFPKHQVTFLQSRDLDAGDFEKLDIRNAAEVSLEKTALYVFGVPVEIEQKTTMDESFLVSTLEPATVLSGHVTQVMDFKTSGPTHPVAMAFGSVNAAPVALDEFALAGIQAPDGMGFFLQTDTAPLPLSVIGLDFLSHYRVLLDYPNGRIYLANPAKDKTPVSAAPAKT